MRPPPMTLSMFSPLRTPASRSCGLRLRISTPPRRHFQLTVHLRDTETATSLSPSLLRRAQALSEQHSVLSSQLADNYDTKLARKLGSLSAVSDALKAYEAANNDLSELHSLISDPKTDPELRSLAADDIASTTSILTDSIKTLQTTLIPKHPFAHLPALVEIRPGTGGSEAAIFALDLWKMYHSYCSNQGLPTVTVNYSLNEANDGLIEGIFEVPVDGAYDTFRTEAGIHRVQRVPATETKGRTHTSTASVMVLPSFQAAETADGEEDPDFAIDMKDVRVDVLRASGAGGQHVNKTESAVRMTHIPTGIVAAVQETRSQLKNREKALAVLKSRLAEKRRSEREAEELKMRRGVSKIGAGRSDKMRTYNYSQNRVTDHRAGWSCHDLPGFMEGGLEEMLRVCKKWADDREVERLAAEAEEDEKEMKKGK
ncbi:release factor [Ascodesmis nigricans]|uniref:Release factor n=1 Tax=Ascodesmis nigricans TaxID=341454 RepID=A0A4S2N6F8_9PEZI|nr:release factor [Ascodesmis nigricans]